MNVTQVAIAAGAGATIWGLTDLFRASIQNDQNQRNALLRRGIKRVALGVGCIATGMALTYLQPVQNIKEVALETQGLKIDPTVCNLDALKSIVEKKLPLANKAFFRSFTCEDFLPWNPEKFSEFYDKTTGIDPKDLSKTVMWGLGPFKEPFIVMTDPNKEEFFSMRFSVDTYESKLITSCKGMYDRYGAKRVSHISAQLGDGLHLLDKDYIKRATEAYCPKIADVFYSFLDERVAPSAIYSATTQALNNITNSI